MPRTPDPEVGGSSPTRVKPCCVLDQGTFTPQKVLVIPRKRWLRPNMTEKLFTGTLRINKPTVQYSAIFKNCKNDNFQKKNCDFLLIFAQNIDCGYTLEPPQCEAFLTSTHNLCFGAKIRKKLYTPVNPSFTI